MTAETATATGETQGVKLFKLEDVKSHNTSDDLWLIIDGKVYDCTSFLIEHPGGEEVMVDVGGVDASQAFEDIAHSEDAYELLKGMYLGDIHPDDQGKISIGSVSDKSSVGSGSSSGSTNVLPLLIALIAALVAFYFAVLNK